MKNNDLTAIPGVGEKIKSRLMNIGINSVEELKGKDAEELYLLDGLSKGCVDDRCLLYVFRLAVYFAENETYEPEKLKWWYWKDK